MTPGLLSLAFVPLLLAGAPRPEAVAALPAGEAAPDLADRATAGLGAGLGALVGGLAGASTALAAGAALAGVNTAARSLPYFALPPALSALGGGLGGAVTGGSHAAWAAGVAGLLGGGGATLGVGLLLLDEPGVAEIDPGEVFLLAVGAPALTAGIGAGVAAALFVE